MKTVIFPLFKKFFFLIALEVLYYSSSSCSGESEKLRLICRINLSKDEWMIDRVNVAVEEGCTCRISPSADHKITSLDISLKPCCL